MDESQYILLTDLPNRLRRQAINVEGDGWVSAARLMNEAAEEISYWRESYKKLESMPVRQAYRNVNVEYQWTPDGGWPSDTRTEVHNRWI